MIYIILLLRHRHPIESGADSGNFLSLSTLARTIWSATQIGAVVLDQEFDVHDNSGVLVHGMASETFIVLPNEIVNRTFCHEYLHCNSINSDKGGLNGIVDEFNLMNHTNDFGLEWLRYRPVTKVLESAEFLK